MSIKCPKCHSDNPNDTIYCGKCASPLKLSEDISVTKTLETPAEQLSVGTTFAGRYNIAGELGKGGMGRVYKVHDTEIKEEVALKLLKPEIASDEHIIERFRNELKIARRVSHKHVCRMFDIGKEGEKYFITMEYVEGQDLKNHIKKEERPSTDEAVSIAKQVCEGLVEAHRLGVVHRDLKPQNIMIDKEGSAKIMDFGIARLVEAPGVTATGMIIGTPDYISPEQAEGQEADHRSDIYSLGVILYEMATGGVPFKGDTALSVALKHKSQLPLDPRMLNPEVSDDLSRLILICMEKDKERRYQSAESLLNDFQNIEEGLPLGTKIKPRRETFVQTLSRKKLLIPGLVVTLAIIAIAIWRLLPQKGAVYPPKIENSIAVISFENLTADENLDDLSKVIPNLIISNLENADLSYVMSWERMRDICKQMGKGDVEYIDSELGFEICRREGAEALVTGSLARAGDMFTIVLRMLDVETKKHLMTANSRGKGADSILETQIDELSREIAQGIGIERQSIEATQFRVRDVTTDSLEAYQYYQKGLEDLYRQQFQDAEKNFQKAVEIDSSFAMAYFYMGRAQVRMGMILNNLFIDATPYKKTMAMAKKYSQETTERERLIIDFGTASVDLDFARAKTISQRLVERYPKEKLGYHYLGSCFSIEQDFERAKRAHEKVLELDPTFVNAYWSLTYTNAHLKDQSGTASAAKKYIAVHPDVDNAYHSAWEVHAMLGLYDNAQRFLDEGLQRHPEWAYLHNWSGINYLLKNDVEKAREKFRTYSELRPKSRFYFTIHMVYSYIIEGKIQRAVSEFRKFVESAQREKNIRLEMGTRNILGRILVAQRKYDEAVDEYNEAEKLSWKFYDEDFNPNSLFAHHLAGIALVSKGDYKAAQERTDIIHTTLQRGNYSVLHSVLYHLLQAEIFAAQKMPQAAQEELGKLPEWLVGTCPRYRKLLAVVHGMQGDFEKAAEEYHNSFSNWQLPFRIMQQVDLLDFFEERSKLDYNLAKIYEQNGETTKATAHYKKFLDLWKDADPGIAEVDDGRKRLEGLKN